MPTVIRVGDSGDYLNAGVYKVPYSPPPSWEGEFVKRDHGCGEEYNVERGKVKHYYLPYK